MSEAVTDDEGGAAAADHRQANLDAALRLAAAGIPIFPVRMFQNEAGEWNKPPLVKDWQRVATTDPVQIKHWWDEFPGAVPGIELEHAGLVVVDTDRHGGPDGVAAMRKLVADHGNLPDGPRTKTAGEGLHLIFKQPDGVQLGNREGSLPEGINVRGAGGYVVAPGAVRPDGARYRTGEGVPDLIEAFATGTIPAVPDWLVDIIGKDGGKNADGPTNNSGLPGDRERAFAATALANSIVEIEQAGRGTRNNTLNSVAYRIGRMIGRGWIEELAVVDGLLQGCHSNGLVNDDGLGSVRNTIESGLSAGRGHPHSDLQDRAISQAESPAAPNVESPPLIPVVWDGEAKHNPTKWLVRDLIPMDSIGLIVGESTSGKSFAAIDLARALGRGAPSSPNKPERAGHCMLRPRPQARYPGDWKRLVLVPSLHFWTSKGDSKTTVVSLTGSQFATCTIRPVC
jgi:hypothetical protein